MTRKILLTLVAVTTLIYFGITMVAQAYQFTAIILGVGLLWFILEAEQRRSLPAAFFMFFIAVTVWGGLHHFPALVMLLGLSCDLAAWDLARFRLRVTAAGQGEIPPALEARHLRQLTLTAVAGFGLALLPLVVSLSINFLVLAVLMLLTIIVLRIAVLFLRSET